MEQTVDTVGAIGQVRAWQAGVPVRRRHSGAPFRGFLGGRFETPEGGPAQGQAFSLPSNNHVQKLGFQNPFLLLDNFILLTFLV